MMDFELAEGQTPDVDPAPNKSTGINVLEELLKKIIPVLETDYKDADNSKSSFGDEYNENMLKAIESRKMEYAAVFSDKLDYSGPKTESPSTVSMMKDPGPK